MKFHFFILLALVVNLKLFSQNCDTVAVKKLYLKADSMLSKDLTKSLGLALESYRKASNCPSSIHFYKALIACTKAYYQNDQPDSIIKLLLPALKNTPSDLPVSLKAKMHHHLSSAYTMKLQLEEGVKYGLSAIKLYEEAHDTRGATNMLVNIGNAYQQQHNFKQADKYLREAEKTAAKLKDSIVAGNVYNSLGILYAENNKLDSSEKFLLKSTVIREALNDNTSIVWNYSNLGGVYTLMKQPRKAIEYFDKAYKKFAQDSNLYGMSSVALNMGEVYMQLKKPEKALEYYLFARKYSGIVGDVDNLENIYTNLSNYYDAQGDFKMAYIYSDSLNVLKDSLFGKRLDRSIAEMQTKFEVEKKDLEITKHKAELELQQEQHRIKNLIIISICALFVLVGVLAYLFYRKKQIEQKAKLDAEIAAQKEIRTRAIIEAEEKERRRIAQDLHDGVGQILSAAKLNLSNYQSKISFKTEEEKLAFKNAVELIDDSVKEVRAVSHNMMPNTLIKLGLASAVREFITKIGNIPNLKIDLEIVGLDKRLNEQTETVLYRVIQEIVNNIIKHSQANHISLQLIKHDTEMTVMIEDNGVGFDTSKISEFAGIGLKNIISRIEFLNGTVDFDSTPGHGTNVIIEVPLV